MKRISHTVRIFTVVLMAGIFLNGCKGREFSQTIVLEDKAEESAREHEYAVKHIKEYFYEGIGKESGCLAWDGDSDNIVIIRHKASGYMYERVDTGKGKVLEKQLLENRPIRSMKISPGGAYLAYEVKGGEGVQLLLRDVKQGVTTGLGDAPALSYAWSGGGDRLFYSFIDGYNEVEHWRIHCVDPVWHAVLKVETEDGSPNTNKEIFPNIDGLKVFVKEELDENIENIQRNKETTGNWIDWQNDETARYWICQHNQKTLDFAGENFEPLCFTEEGLYVRKKTGTVFLMDNLEKYEDMKQVMDIGEADVFFCTDGDHMFLLDREKDTQQIQIQSVELEKGQVKNERMLYKESFGDILDVVISPDDSAIAIRSCKHRAGKKYDYKVTVLEYKNMIFS